MVSSHPMMAEQFVLFAILAAALVCFVWGRLRYDLIAVLALLAAVVSGVVPASEAFMGFGHPAVVTVAAILILSRALRNSDVVGWVSAALEPVAGHPTRQLLALTALTAACSAFMNNVGALALLLPVALHGAIAAKRPNSQLLMPLSFASLLGGLITLIGTPPNIVIANFRAEVNGEPFGMFDFAPVGLIVAVVGIAYIALVGWRLLPQGGEPPKPDAPKPLLDIDDYITEVRLPAKTAYVGKRIAELEALGQEDVSVVALVRGRDRILAPSGFLKLQGLTEKAGLTLVGAAGLSAENLRSERVGLVEAVIIPGSSMEGRTARSLRLHTRHGVNLLAVSRQGEPIQERLGQVRFMAGDVLLLQGEVEALPDSLAQLGCLPLAERGLELGRKRTGSVFTPVLFVAAILLTTLGILPPQIAFVAAAVGVVLIGDLQPRELYESVDWPIVVLLGAMIPVGLALESTGGSATIAQPILLLGGHAPVWVILTLLMIMTMLLSDIINNAATAVLMAPIGITIAQGLGVNPDPFLMAVAIGASSTFLTPIGHQSNLLVMGPGGYRFSDYWRMGLPLDALIVAVSIPAILWFWPA
jgi:di/tricarboxylate transporter